MSAVDVSLNFDDLVQAVRESSRGRWFLDEYESRLRKSDTGNILAAIAKLENAVATMGPTTEDAAIVARAKSAIAAARSEIANLTLSDAKLSEEARLFARLAEMARASFQPETPVKAGVNRALQLMDQLEQEFGTAPAAAGKSEFFAQDADMFEAPAKAPLMSAKPLAPPKDIERGAKLTIQRVSDPQAATADQIAAAPEAGASVGLDSTQPPEPRRSRVVIVRRRPEELQELPMINGEAEAVSAA
jgi:hypothetical protein